MSCLNFKTFVLKYRYSNNFKTIFLTVNLKNAKYCLLLHMKMIKMGLQISKETYHNLTYCNVKLFKYMALFLLARPKTIEEANLIISHIKYFFSKKSLFLFIFSTTFLPPNRQTADYGNMDCQVFM